MDDINSLFQDYLAAHSDEGSIDFAPLLEKHPQHRESLERKVAAYHKIVGAFCDAPTTEQQTASLIGKEIGGCKLLKIIGQGGMGVVYLGYQQKLRREVVVKVLRPFAVDNQALKERFLRESRTIGRLNHKNIVPVYDVGEENGSFYIIMKHVEGISLSALIQRLSVMRASMRIKDIVTVINSERDENGPLKEFKSPTEFFCNLIIRVADAVQYAHDNSVIHRDIKPSNIIVEPDGNPVLLDFGLSHDEIEQNLTLSGEFLGTPIYSAPELFSKSTTTNHRLLDVYSLGVTLYELITGGLPYEGNNIYEIYSNIKSKEPVRPRIRWANISRDLETVVTTAIAKKPQLRYESIGSLSSDLRNFLNYQPITAKVPSTGRRILYFVKRNKYLSVGVLSSVIIILLFFYSTITASKLKSAEAHNKIYSALAMLQRGNKQSARQVFEQILKEDPNNTKAFAELIHMRLMDGENPQGLLIAVNKKLEKAVDEVNLLEIAGALHNNLKDYQSGRIAAEKILTKNPDNFIAFLILAEVIINQQNNLEEGRLLVDKFNALYPNEPGFNRLLWAACMKNNNYDCALKYIHKAAEQNPKEDTKILAQTYALARDFERAVEVYRTVLSLNPGDAKAHSEMAVWLAELELFEEALTHAKIAVSIDPKSDDYLFTLNRMKREKKTNWFEYKRRGFDLMQAGKYFEAVDVLKRAMIFNNQDDQLYALIGYSLLKIGNLEAAVEYLEKAHKLKPTNKQRKAILDSVKSRLKVDGIGDATQR